MRKIFIFILLCSIGSSAFTQTNSTQEPIRILSYNIQLLPRWIAHLKHFPMKRVEPLAKELLKDSIDVIVFQEAFSKPCYRKLAQLLSPYFPYSAGPANEKCGKLSSGVFMMSKTPLKVLGTIDFKDCEKEDCFARKGALLVQTYVKNSTIQILGTHMEAGGTAELKTRQFMEIKNLCDKYIQDGIPQFLCGDFNIRKSGDLYPKLVAELELSDSDPIGELKFSSDHALNDMNPLRPNDRTLIDYIFLRNDKNAKYTVTREIKRYTANWHKTRRDLSDHFAILARIYVTQ